MKKLTALFLSLLLVLTMTAALAETDITLWTFPIGDWGNSEKVDEMLAAFNAVHPDIKVTVEYLDYTNGDAQITTAIEAKTTPDIVMEGPERLVANWAAAARCFRSTICGRTRPSPTSTPTTLPSWRPARARTATTTCIRCA